MNHYRNYVFLSLSLYIGTFICNLKHFMENDSLWNMEKILNIPLSLKSSIDVNFMVLFTLQYCCLYTDILKKLLYVLVSFLNILLVTVDMMISIILLSRGIIDSMLQQPSFEGNGIINSLPSGFSSYIPIFVHLNI